jgi:predicted PurR-regulated permease PerM
MLTPTISPSDSPLIHSPSGDPLSETQRAREFVRRYDAVALGIGALGLIAFIYSLGSLINPFVLFLALYLILAPYREYRAARSMMWTAGVLFFLWFFWTTSSILIPFILAGVIAYLFNPLVTKLHKNFGIARIWSSIAIVTILMGILAILGWLFVPTLVDQAGSLVTRLSAYISSHSNQLDEKYLKRVLIRIGVPAKTSDQLVTGQVTPRVREVIGQIPAFILQLIESIPTFVERMLNYIIVPFAGVYLLRDWNKFEIFILDMFPQRTRARRETTYNKIDTLLYRYVRGQITMAIIIGTIGMIAFWILGIPYYGLLGVVLMISDLIPIVGMIFSVVVVEIVILLTMQLSVGVVLSGVLVIGGLHTLEAYILGPKIVGEGIGIPPIIMILSLLIFGYFLGFLGLLIAVPSTAVIMMFVNEYRKQQTESTP